MASVDLTYISCLSILTYLLYLLYVTYSWGLHFSVQFPVTKDVFLDVNGQRRLKKKLQNKSVTTTLMFFFINFFSNLCFYLFIFQPPLAINLSFLVTVSI